MPIKVSIVEDNQDLRTTLARMINKADGFECVSQYGTAEAALDGLPKDRPEVVLMDINLPGINGVECVRRLKQVAPEIAAVMLTAYEDTENIFNALAAGATGYLLKRAPRAEILDAAEAWYAKKGWDALTMDQVARSARLSRALVYVYFRDKDDLLFAIGERAVGLLLDRFKAAVAGTARGSQLM